MNNKNGYAATTLYRYVGSSMKESAIASFEEELCELLSVGYSVVSSYMADGFMVALLTKKLPQQTVVTDSMPGEKKP